MTMTSDEILVRWMIRRDFDRVMQMERESYPEPWTESEMMDYVTSKTRIGMVACMGDLVVGSMLYDRQPNHFHIDAVTVDQDYRREGVGSAMLRYLAKRVGHNGKQYCATVIRETNLEALRFFRASGFVATELVHRPWDDCSEDGYRLVYERSNVKRILANRIAR